MKKTKYSALTAVLKKITDKLKKLPTGGDERNADQVRKQIILQHVDEFCNAVIVLLTEPTAEDLVLMSTQVKVLIISAKVFGSGFKQEELTSIERAGTSIQRYLLFKADALPAKEGNKVVNLIKENIINN